MSFSEWLLPFRSIATSLRRLVELRELEMEASGLLMSRAPILEASVAYQDDLYLSERERKQLEWIAAGRRPLAVGEDTPGVPQ